MNKTIVLENLTKLYPSNRGIDHINLEVDSRDIFGFLGPNGAGKTTAMKIMAGLLQPDSGQVLINGYSVHNNYEKAMADVGCIIESVSLFPYLTAYENLKLCARYYQNTSASVYVDDNRIDHCLELTGMLKFRNEKTKNFSLGMKQRTGLAMAILSHPKILILDEPLNGLDVDGMVEMRKLFLHLSENESTTIFISSHLIHDVELTCNRVAIINKGQMLKTGYTEQILNDHSSLENYYISEVGDIDEHA